LPIFPIHFTSTSVGQTAELSVTRTFVDGVRIDGIWSDWELGNVEIAVDPDQLERVDERTLLMKWDRTQPFVGATVPVSLPDRYVGGTFRLDADGQIIGNSSTAMIDINIK
jgi:hypothetical protein